MGMLLRQYHDNPDHAEGVTTTADVSTPGVDPPAVGESPKGNASHDEWEAYARTQGATDEDLDGLGRDAIRDKYTL